MSEQDSLHLLSKTPFAYKKKHKTATQQRRNSTRQPIRINASARCANQHHILQENDEGYCVLRLCQVIFPAGAVWCGGLVKWTVGFKGRLLLRMVFVTLLLTYAVTLLKRLQGTVIHTHHCIGRCRGILHSARQIHDCSGSRPPVHWPAGVIMW